MGFWKVYDKLKFKNGFNDRKIQIMDMMGPKQYTPKSHAMTNNEVWYQEIIRPPPPGHNYHYQIRGK